MGDGGRGGDFRHLRPNLPPRADRRAEPAVEASPLARGATMRMKDKRAIVTGAASGLGKEIARAFAREGAKVCIADLVLDQAQATASEITRSGGTAMALTMDVTVSSRWKPESQRQSSALEASMFW